MNAPSMFVWVKRWFIARLANIPFWTIKRAHKRALDHSISVAWDDLAAHFLAGGSVQSLVDGLVYAQSVGIILPYRTACAQELIARMSYRISLREYLTPFVQEGMRDFTNALPQWKSPESPTRR
jgi:uncharacterized protein YqfA (UPF0365 family)